jgi:hypothetical protein
MEVGGQAAPFPFFGEGQSRGHEPELFLVRTDVFFGLFLARDILDHADDELVFDPGAPEEIGGQTTKVHATIFLRLDDLDHNLKHFPVRLNFLNSRIIMHMITLNEMIPVCKFFVELSGFSCKLENFRSRSLRWLEVARGLPSAVFEMVERRRVNKTPGLPRPCWLQIMTVPISNPDDIVSVLRVRAPVSCLKYKQAPYQSWKYQ